MGKEILELIQRNGTSVVSAFEISNNLPELKTRLFEEYIQLQVEKFKNSPYNYWKIENSIKTTDANLIFDIKNNNCCDFLELTFEKKSLILHAFRVKNNSDEICNERKMKYDKKLSELGLGKPEIGWHIFEQSTPSYFISRIRELSASECWFTDVEFYRKIADKNIDRELELIDSKIISILREIENININV